MYKEKEKRVREIVNLVYEAENNGNTLSLGEIVPPRMTHMMDRDEYLKFIKLSRTELTYDEFLSALRDIVKLNN